ncbi:flagellar basal body-associated FliL family protein [Arthrobacter sp. NEB 688]|uniref:flagellar basal body-associated FliL family protein n=1 Tax=Arthrobacter sp. NEB 688 TaxID=904039 RepID=UPI001566BB69|nr:flagellar basal body-associated FliL family protein [Arthrobacter sp. NEB 688]QKE82664.1 flagellar basal body protein FliL [Arthrobacter sp. NEB 688]
MSTATVPAAAAAAAEPEKKKKPMMLIAIVLVLLMAGGGYWFFLKPSSDSAEEPKPEPTPGVVVDLDPLTLNLSDGRYLKMGLSLEVTEEAQTAAGKEGVNGAKARDAAISILGQRTYEQMLQPKTKEAAIKTLEKEIKKRYDGDVMDVYVTELVMQ